MREQGLLLEKESAAWYAMIKWQRRYGKAVVIINNSIFGGVDVMNNDIELKSFAEEIKLLVEQYA
jgi:hypothetical protein